MNNKEADQTARMRRLVCAFVVRTPPKTGFLASRPICVCGSCFDMQYLPVVSFLVLQSSRRGRQSWLLYFGLSSLCRVTVSVLWDFLIKPWVGLLCVIVVFPDHTHFVQQESSIFYVQLGVFLRTLVVCVL